VQPLDSSRHFMESEGLLPHLQKLVNVSYSETDQSSPHHPLVSLQDLSSCYLHIYVLAFLVVTLPLAFLPITYRQSSFPHPSYKTLLPHPPRLDNYTWQRIQITQLICMHFSPLFCLNILLSTLFSNTPSLFPSLTFRIPVSHIYKTTGTIIVCIF
jgi:hypothetical protein